MYKPKKFLSMFLAAVIGLGVFVLASCSGDKKNSDPYANIKKEYLYGMDEPVCEIRGRGSDGSIIHTVEGFDMDITADLLKALGVKAFRFRIPMALMQTATRYDESIYNYLKSCIKKLKDAGVERLVCLIEVFPKDSGFRPDDDKSVPHSDDPNYENWLDSVYEYTKTICGLFPEITHWEMLNEANSANFFHPNGYNKVDGVIDDQAGGFDAEEQVLIYTDYMYYMSKAIRESSPENIAVTSGFAPTESSFLSIQYFLEDIYARIASGVAPSTLEKKSSDKRDYFDALCWHPYMRKFDDSWLDYNNGCYNVAIQNGDEGIPVYFTEFGWTDLGDQDAQDLYMEYTARAFEFMENDMPYVESCMSFRMYQCSFATGWGGERQNYFGFFTEPVGANKGFAPRPKAYKLQQIYGGTGDLEQYADLTALK